jgi:ligand-binding SRPBCC domain-containing protein
MPVIVLETRIHSSLQICFDLSRSIDLHRLSTASTKEEAVAGVISGLINAGESVTWEATHFGIRQRLTAKITAFDFPSHFRDQQIKGAFKSMVHDHYFEAGDGCVVMKDVFNFESPFGLLGRLFNFLVLTRYMTGFLETRNAVITDFAESGKWQELLSKD